MKTGCKGATLRHRVTFKVRSVTDDGQGGKTEGDLVPIHDAPNQWAKIEPVTRRETFESMQLQGNLTHKITTRYRRFAESGEEPVKLIIEYIAPGGVVRRFEVLGQIDKDERHFVLEWLCEEQQADGTT